MTEENRETEIPVEEQVVEDVQPEVNKEEQAVNPTGEDVAAEQEPEVDLSLDFPEVEELQVEQEAEPNYDDVLEDFANKLMAKQQAQVDKGEITEDDDEFVSKKDLEKIKEAWKQEQREEAYRRQQEEAILLAEQQRVNQVRSEYVNKMTDKCNQLGIDLTASQDLTAAADLMWRNMQMNALQHVAYSEQRTNLKPAEVAALAREHWKHFSNVFLKGRINKQPSQAPGNENLSLAGQAINESQGTTQHVPSAWEQYQQKKASGAKLDPVETLRLLKDL